MRGSKSSYQERVSRDSEVAVREVKYGDPHYGAHRWKARLQRPSLTCPLELELQMLANCQMWLLGTKHGSSGRAKLS